MEGQTNPTPAEEEKLDMKGTNGNGILNFVPPMCSTLQPLLLFP